MFFETRLFFAHTRDKYDAETLKTVNVIFMGMVKVKFDRSHFQMNCLIEFIISLD